MATIIKRKKAYSVVYNYVDENGETKQKWETVHTHKEALRRKAEVENTQNAGTFLPPNKQTVREFLHDFVATYGERKWSISMYDGQLSLISNYINPIIGDLEVQSITPRVVDKYIQTLQKTPSAARKNRKTHAEYVTNSTIERIFKLLRCAFKQAVRWELIGKNPFDNAILPKTVYKKRDIWDADTIRKALDQCEDSKLYIAMNLSFACSLRMGEILGLSWKNVHIEDEDIATDNAYIYIDAELERASKQAIETLGKKDIYHIFTPLMPNTSTRLVLKKPKTDSSIRKVWLPKTVAYILRDWRKAQNELKGFLGGEYQDFDLVVALPNGRPCEARIINKEFVLLKEKAGLPNVVFHSLRHPYVKHTTKIFSLRLMDFQAQAYPDARRKTRGACQLLRVGQSRSPVRPLCNRKRFSCLPPQSKMSWILYAISMRLSGYTSTRSISSSASSVVSVSASKIALDASFRLSCRACSSCFCFACANTAA